jgi:hypothetical protein
LLSILLKNPRSSFENLRTNGGACEIIGDFSVHAEPVEAFLGFFSGIAFLTFICGLLSDAQNNREGWA